MEVQQIELCAASQLLSNHQAASHHITRSVNPSCTQLAITLWTRYSVRVKH